MPTDTRAQTAADGLNEMIAFGLERDPDGVQMRVVSVTEQVGGVRMEVTVDVFAVLDVHVLRGRLDDRDALHVVLSKIEVLFGLTHIPQMLLDGEEIDLAAELDDNAPTAATFALEGNIIRGRLEYRLE